MKKTSLDSRSLFTKNSHSRQNKGDGGILAMDPEIVYSFVVAVVVMRTFSMFDGVILPIVSNPLNCIAYQ